MAAYDHQPGFHMDDASSIAYKNDLEAALGHPLNDKSMLELGCGSGTFTQFLTSLAPRVTGIDKSEQEQQTRYLPGWEQRFQIMLDALDDLPLSDFAALDLASDPNAVSQRLLTQFRGQPYTGVSSP